MYEVLNKENYVLQNVTISDIFVFNLKKFKNSY